MLCALMTEVSALGVPYSHGKFDDISMEGQIQGIDDNPRKGQALPQLRTGTQEIQFYSSPT